MRRWQLAALVLGPAALLCTAQPAQAQVRFGGRRPVVIAPAPVVVAPAPVVVAPAPVVVTPAPVVVTSGWGATPYWGGRRARRAYRHGGWYGAARGPRGRYVAYARGW